MNLNNNAAILLYDGVCGFCNKAVKIVLTLDRKATIHFASLQSSYAKRIIERHPYLLNIDSVVFVEQKPNGENSISVKSDALLRIAARLGGVYKLTLLGYLIPRAARNFLYDLIARHRYKFFGKNSTCLLPSKEVKDRFIEI